MTSSRQPSLRERALPLLELTRYNPPGLPALTYRGAPYRTSLARMLARLPNQTLGTDPDAKPPLASINTGDDQDWTIALLHAWAVVMDVLSFYQERFTNEGYLATAVEERSVLELARAIGYELSPGVSAKTDLAFTVVKRPDQPHQIARLPAGLAVRSVAIPGQLSQVFETSQPLEARSEWNALRPARYDDVRWRQDIRQDATSLRLAGVQTGLAPGDTLIVVSRPWFFRIHDVSDTLVRWVDETGAERSIHLPTHHPDLQAGDAMLLVQEPVRLGPSRPSLVVTLKTVNVVPHSGTTLISYQHPTYGLLLQQVAGSQTGLQSGDRLLLVDRHFMTKLDPETDLADLDNEKLTGNIQAAFDENQLELPAEAKLVIKTRGKAWAVQDAKGQPLYEIRLIDDKFVIYEDPAWLVASVKAVKNEPNLNRTTLELEQDPAVERGSRPIRNPGVFALRQKAALFGYTATGFFMNQEEPVVWRPQGIGLPDGVIRACVRHPQGELFVITEQGLFRSSDEAANWQPLTLGLARKNIYALALTGDDHLLAGADDGSIYLSKDKGDNWAALSGETLEPPRRGLKKLWPTWFASANLPKTVVRALVTYRDWRGAYIAAGTDVGVFRSSDGGRSWRPINRDLPNQDAKTGLTDTIVYALTAVEGKYLYAATSAGVFQIRNRAQRVVGRAVIGGAVLGGLLCGLWALAGPYVGQPGLIGRLLTWYVQLFNSIVTDPKLALMVPLVALAGLSLIAARHFLIQYLSILEQIDVPTFALQTTPDGASMFAATEKGVFRTERREKWYRRLLAPGRPWRAINQTASAPLFLVDRRLETDLDQGILTEDIKREFTEHQHELPDQAQLIVKTKGKAWAVQDASGRTVYEIGLINDHLVVYGGLILPRAILAQALQPDLGRGRLSNELQEALKEQQIELPPGTRLFIATPGEHWQLLNTRDVPLYEIRRVDSTTTPATPDVLVLFEVQTVQALGLKRAQDASGASDLLLAGTQAGQLYHLPLVEDKAQWERYDAGMALSLSDVRSIAVVGNTQYVTGQPAAGKIETRWTSEQLTKKWVDLDLVYPAIQPESWLVIRQAGPKGSRLYRVQNAPVISSADLLNAGQFTRLEVDRAAGLDRFDRQLSQVWANSQPLAFFDDCPLQGQVIVLDRHVPGLEPGKRLIVRGKPMRARIITEGLELQSLKNLETVVLHAGASLQVLSLKETGTPGKKRWRLRNANRFEGQVVTSYGEIVFEPAADDDAALNEVVTIKDVKDSADQTTLTLEQPLGTVYDRTTLSLLGNVVPATHGVTVAQEVLGSSDGRQANQRFRLRQSPLTYLPAASAFGSRSTLEVRVNGVEWQAEPSFNRLKPNDRAYLVRQDERSQSVIIFGDGQQGARLPTSDEEITASYRIGTGPEGNVPAESLTQPQTRIENLQSVTNPLPAAGGTAREHRHRARSRAPLSLRSSQRIVSLSDYQDFAGTFPGIGQARADMVWAGNRQWLHITVADREGNPVRPGSDLFQSLAAAIQAQRALPDPPVHIDPFEAVYFNVEANLWIDPEHQARKQAIQSAVEQALASTYSFEQREFGQPVAATEVIACMQSADAGILGLELRHFALYTEQKRPIVQDKLESRSARWQDGRLHPAQLLLINATGEGGIVLNLEMAT